MAAALAVPIVGNGDILFGHEVAPTLGFSGPRPLVYYIHGGPQSQERPDFAWFSMPLIQFLTLNGLAVFVPNVRGSAGYGLRYMKRVDRDWGGADRLDHVKPFHVGHVMIDQDEIYRLQLVQAFQPFPAAARLGYAHAQILEHAGEQPASRPDAVQFSEILGSVVARDVDRLHRREPCLDQQLHLALVSEAGDHSAHASRIQSSQQQSAGLREGILKFQFFLESCWQG